uniref:Uncharacterized protein n=1 Tax=Arundo donax TaxID=35708 RepID=A0A0A9BNB8_ARUDO
MLCCCIASIIYIFPYGHQTGKYFIHFYSLSPYNMFESGDQPSIVTSCTGYHT